MSRTQPLALRHERYICSTKTPVLRVGVVGLLSLMHWVLSRLKSSAVPLGLDQ